MYAENGVGESRVCVARVGTHITVVADATRRSGDILNFSHRVIIIKLTPTVAAAETRRFIARILIVATGRDEILEYAYDILISPSHCWDHIFCARRHQYGLERSSCQWRVHVLGRSIALT